MEISADELKKFSDKKTPLMERMGLEMIESKKGYVKLKAPLAAMRIMWESCMPEPFLPLAEVPGGSLFYTSFDPAKYYPVVKDMYIRFRRPAATDVFIEMRMSEDEADRIQKEADENGKADFILEGEIKDETGEIVALSKGTYQIRAVAG